MDYFQLVAAELATNLKVSLEIAKEVILQNGFETEVKRTSLVTNGEKELLPKLQLDQNSLIIDVVWYLRDEINLSKDSFDFICQCYRKDN